MRTTAAYSMSCDRVSARFDGGLKSRVYADNSFKFTVKRAVMKYIVIAVVLVALFLLFYKILKPLGGPDFKLSGAMSTEALLAKIGDLAVNCTFYGRGAGLSGGLVKKTLDKNYLLLLKKVASDEGTLDFENWLYDNHYVVEGAVKKAKKVRLMFKLPHVGGVPRVYSLLSLVVKGQEGKVDAAVLAGAVKRFNDIAPLTYDEVCAIPVMLDFCLCEFLAILASKSGVINKRRRRAGRDVLKDRVDLASLSYNSYVFEYMNLASAEQKRNFASLCADNGLDVGRRIDNFYLQTARYSGMAGAAVKSLREKEAWLTDKLILSFCPAAAVLESVPGVCFKRLKLSSKFVYMYYVAKRAKKEKLSEPAFAVRAADEAMRRNVDIAELILPPPSSRTAMRIYIALMLAAALVNSLIFAFFASSFKIVSIFLLMPISLALILGIFNEIIGRFGRRRYLPRLDYRFIDKNEAKTLIVYTVLVGSEREAEACWKKLLTAVSANNDEIFSYALLVDLPAARNENLSENDEKILDALKRGYERAKSDRVNYIVRRRRKVKGEDKYQGWEKKRGALLELNEYLLKGKENFLARGGALPSCRYVITLDSDSVINCARELVEIMEHPLNLNKSVVSLHMKTNPYEVTTPFARLMCGSVGIGNYSEAMSEVNYDFFDSGNYTGKGIYRVREFHERVAPLFPEGRLLSHDFIEGGISGCANSDLAGLDSFPLDYSAYLKRSVRWLRGDIQLLPYLKKRVKNAAGERIKNPLSPIGKWHIFCNIFSGLIPIVSLALIVFACILNSPLYLLGAFTLNIGALLNAVRRSFLYEFTLLQELARQLLAVAMLPVAAWQYLRAFVVTVVRLLRGKKLLEWNVFAHSKGRIGYWPGAACAAALVAVTAIFRLNFVFYFIAALFMSGIVWDIVLGRTYKEKQLSVEDRVILSETVKSTMTYFERMRVPSDNFQEGIGYVERTSPTDLGYTITSYVCAAKLNVVGRSDALKAIENVLNFIESSPKWHGNLYNWLDGNSGAPLEPRYVSTVDNGNLLCCLIMAGEELDEIKERAYGIARNMELERLFDNDRGLMRIGYNDSGKSYDNCHYDLMASESMLTYIAAIGFNKIDRAAFDNLSRRCVRDRGSALYSWSGGLFEYLMSDLFVPYPKYGLLYNSARAAVNSQIGFSRRRRAGLWGMSESQYAATDDNGLYQYRAFGLERIAVSNERSREVFSPYSAFLALSVRKGGAMKNISSFKAAGASGEMGFMESVDEGRNVASYMTHHQGMIMLAASRALGADLSDGFGGCPAVEAAKLLISVGDYERRPRRKPRFPKARPEAVAGAYAVCYGDPPPLKLMTGGRYAILIDSAARGYSAFDGKLIGRREDERSGMDIELKIDGAAKKSLFGRGEAFFDVHEALFQYSDGQTRASMRVSALPNFSGEMRSFEISNMTGEVSNYELIVKLEMSMTDINKELAHKTFNQMFIRGDYDAETDALLMSRTDEKKGFTVAFYFDKSAAYDANAETDPGHMRFGQVLTPAAVGRCSFRLAAYESISVRLFIIASYDVDYLKRAVKLTKSSGYGDRISAGLFALAKSLNPRRATCLKASLLLYKSPFVPQELGGICNVEKPLVFYRVTSENLPRLRGELKELKKLPAFNIHFNLVLAFEDEDGYFKRVQREIGYMVEELGLGAIFAGQSRLAVLPYEHPLCGAAQSCAVDFDRFRETCLSFPPASSGPRFVKAALPPDGIVYPLYLGGYNEKKSYVIDKPTPRPWSNIISNGEFGFLITAAGGGYTFYDNAKEHKISEWSNDAVGDRPSEFVALEEDGEVWSVTRLPITRDCDYRAEHALGYSRFLCNYNGILADMRVYAGGQCKYFDLNLKSETEKREINVMLAVKCVLGDTYYASRRNLVFSFNDGVEVLNRRSGLNAFLGCSEKITNYAYHKQAFCRPDGSVYTAHPVEAGWEPFPSVAARLLLEKGVGRRIIFSLGGKPDFAGADAAFEASAFRYPRLSSLRLVFGTPLDYIAAWLPYQVLCSRFYGRTGFYQAGGAFGFRDQLQDCLALLYVDTALVRKHIILCAAHQFEKGDVMHWWHFDCSGVRTRIMDDRLYLPLVTAEYIAFTGDDAILNEQIPFLNNAALPDGAGDVYVTPGFTVVKRSLAEHCRLALISVLEFGENGLLLMRGGDWNDGMNRVGREGKGTTVWGSMFAFYVTGKFLPFAASETRKIILEAREDLRLAVDGAYNGGWYNRAYTDDGRVLGRGDSPECKIDLITQAFAVISGIAPDDKRESAMDAAYAMLVEEKSGVVKLLTPPLKEIDAGYIRDYPPGVRENGGQYTHGAIWFAIAMLELDRNETAYKLIKMLNPVRRCLDPEAGARYKIEPYVIAADVYAGDYEGCGGWSWYTGSAGWYYKCLIEGLLGITIRGDTISFAPRLPREIKNAEVVYRSRFGDIKIVFDAEGDGEYRLRVGGVRYSTMGLTLGEKIVGKTITVERSKK